jgi:hypothetical protein
MMWEFSSFQRHISLMQDEYESKVKKEFYLSLPWYALSKVHSPTIFFKFYFLFVTHIEK